MNQFVYKKTTKITKDTFFRDMNVIFVPRLEMVESITMGSANNVQTAVTSRFLCIKIIDSNGNKLGYNEQPLIIRSFFCFF